MEYKELLTTNGISLIRRGEKNTEYAVVRNLNKEKGEWDHTIAYFGYGYYHPQITEAEALANALDVYRSKNEAHYIPYGRLSEIAQMAIDGMMGIDVNMSIEICKEEIELDEEELEYFHIAEAMHEEGNLVSRIQERKIDDIEDDEQFQKTEFEIISEYCKEELVTKEDFDEITRRGYSKDSFYYPQNIRKNLEGIRGELEATLRMLDAAFSNPALTTPEEDDMFSAMQDLYDCTGRVYGENS